MNLVSKKRRSLLIGVIITIVVTVLLIVFFPKMTEFVVKAHLLEGSDNDVATYPYHSVEQFYIVEGAGFVCQVLTAFTGIILVVMQLKWRADLSRLCESDKNINDKDL